MGQPLPLFPHVYWSVSVLLADVSQGFPAAAKLRELFSYDLVFAGKVLKPVLPVVANEMLWSLGITAYSVVYARIRTDSIAAMNIVASIEQMAFVLFQAIGHACAILVGNRIGGG